MTNTTVFIALTVFIIFVSLFAPHLMPTQTIMVDANGNALPLSAYTFKYDPNKSVLGGPVWFGDDDSAGYLVQSFKFMLKLSTYQIQGAEAFSVLWTFVSIMWVWCLANLIRGNS